MSGEKAGRVDPPAGHDQSLLLPILGAGVVMGAALGGTAIGFGMATRGMFRLGKQTYDRIDEHIEQAVARDLQEQLERIEQYRGDLERYRERENTGRDFSEQELETEEEQYQRLLARLNELKEARQSEEVRKGLRDDLSLEFGQRIAELERQLRGQRQPQARRPQNNNATIQRLGEDIRAALKEIEPYDPLFVLEQRTALATLRAKERAYSIKLREIMDRKESLSHANQDVLLVLSTQYQKVLQHPLYGKLSQEEQDQLRVQFKDCISRVKASPSRYQNEEEFKGKFDSYLKQAREREMQDRFAENISRLHQAMNNAGYKHGSQQDAGSHLLVSYRAQTDGAKQVHLTLKKPDAENDTGEDFSMQVMEAGFGTEEKRRAEGKRIMQEIESIGIRIDYLDLTAAIDPEKDRDRVCKHVKDRISSKHGLNSQDVQVTWSSGSEIMINGTPVTVGAKSVVQVVHEYLNKARVGQIGEAQRLREGQS